MSTWNPSIPSTSSCELQEVHGSRTGLEAPSRKLKVTLLSSEWKSTKGGLSTINRELAIQLAKHQNVEVSMYLPECSEEDERIAGKNNVKLIQAKKLVGYEPIEWLSCAPENHKIDYVIGHGLKLGRQVQLIQRYLKCKWVQVVHTAPEDLGKFKIYANAISKAEEKHKAEIELCELADEVVAIGPRLADEYSRYLRHCQRDQSVFQVTPSIFSEFSLVKQAAKERKTFLVLVFGRGDTEDFELKGYDIAAKAISELNEESYQLIFVGAPLGGEEEVAEKLCQHGIARRQLTVRSFKESREDLVRLFCEVDLFIMPSRTEGFGLAALEALSAGLPILVSGNSGFGDALQNVPHGSSCVVNSEDPKEWARAIKIVCKKRRDIRLKETKNVCLDYAEEYSWEKQCGELVGRMLDSIFGTHQATEGEQESPLTRSHLPTTVVCEGYVEPTDKKGKRPLHPSVIPPSKKQGHDTDICIACLRIQIGVEAVTEGSAQRDTGMQVHPREPQDVVQEVRVPNTGLTTENIGNICSQSTQALLNRIAELYLQHVSLSNPEQFNGFIVYLKEVRKVLVLDVTSGSLIVTVEVGSEELLEELWKDYRTGHLNEVAQKFLVTEELLEECGLIELKLTLHIAEEEYKACKRYFWGTRHASESEQDSSLPTLMAAEASVEPTDKKGKRPLHPRRVIPPSRKRRHDTDTWKDKKGKRPLYPSVTSSKKRRHDTDTWREIHPATEASSVTRSHLATTADTQTLDTGVPERQAAEKLEKTPFHQNAASPRKKQTHDTDIREVGVAGRQAAENLEKTPSLHICEGAHLMGSCYALFPAAIADTAVVRKLLTQDYKRRAEFSPLLWSKAMKLHLDEVYTRLKIVSRPKRIVHPASLEIDLGNIFSCEGDVSMALAEGSPGIGKTTLCLKLAYDWANESMPSTFPKFKLVLLLKCRDLDGDIMEAISEQLLPDDIAVKTKEGLLNFITDLVNQKRILIILDGLDELPEKSQHHVSKLLKRSILPFCYVLTTTRQEKGIEARKQFAFDICVQIEGFTEEDSFEYIRKHFKNIDPSKGERLIEETKENTFLHALQKNPLNLLLLCVVYEDHEGKLPSSRTNLYQIIVRCLLRRYCEKNSVKACEEDSDLEKQFEANILVLGELAWECLLNDRHSFREDELTKFERSDDKLVVRYLGLVFKEESLKRLKPNHEYFFLHKSFQEYMAAFYIAHKLRRNQFKVFKRLSFHQLVIKFPQVFLFVCGILLEDASTLFTQIGEELKSYWDWLQCNLEETRFFLESFSESGNPEQMAYTLFPFIPFPRVLQLFVDPNEVGNYVGGDLVRLLSTCTGIPEVPKPAEVHLKITMSWDFTVFRELASIPNVTSIYFLADKYIFREPEFFKEISNFTSLSELTLPSAVEWKIVADYLRTNKTLEKLTFALFDESDDGWAKALDAGLCADTPLSTVGVRIHGSLSPAALQALENLLFNKFLSSLSLYIYGDMKDSLAVVLARGLAGEIAVKEVDLCVSGKLSLHGAKLIERGIVGNNSRTKLIVSLRGEVPDNWQALGNNLHSRFGQKTPALITIHPNTFSKVTASQVAHFRPFGIMGGSRVRQNVTLNVWGELGGDGAEALFEGLSRKHVSHLTLDIHGKLTDDILNTTARWVEERNTQSSLTINAWAQLTKKEKNLFEELKLDKNPAVTLNVRDVPAPPEESRDNEFVSIDNLDSLIALFKEGKNTRKKHNLSARISIESDDEAEECNVLPGKEILKNSDLGNGVHAGVASNSNFSREPNVHAPPEESRDDEFVSIHDVKSLIALFKEAKNTGKQNLSARISIKRDDDEDKDDDDDEDDDEDSEDDDGEDDDGEDDDDDDDDDGEDDDDGDDDDDDAEGCNGNLLDLTRKETLKNSDLGNGVDVGAASNTSFIAPTPLNINYTNFSREPEDGLDHVLASNTTLNDLRLTFDDDDDDDMSYSWALPLGDGLARNTSLKNLTLAIHYYKEKSGKWRESLGSGLERNTSLKNLTVVMENNANEVAGELGIDWARSTSVENLFLTVNSDSIVWDSWTGGPGTTGEELARKKSLKSLTLTINNFGELTLYWEVDKSWENNSLNNFSLTINNYGNIRPRSCFKGFFFQFKSLTTFNLTLNLCGKPGEDILYGLLEEAVKSQSLKTLRLKVNDSQITNGRRRYDFSRYVVTSPSLSLLEVTVSFYSVEKSSRE
ncbi:uncharacterized protein [Montipora capricornis]|uniref:uncharacterized protein isoform X2 n=1 Tax=Montipora capricornis TaxID=246305 RepID=UPI0035F1C408